MKKQVFMGAAVAIVTPFRDGKVDYQKLRELIEFQIAHKIDAVVVCGTTGESSALSHDEHISVVRFVVETVKRRVPVIAGAGSNNTQHAVDLSVELEKVGADALLSVVPYYNKTSQRGLVTHFSTIARAVAIPIILYNIPSRTSFNMTPETIREIAENETVVGIKECNLYQVGEIVKLCGPEFSIYSGDDSTILPVLAYGGKGVISTMANIIPEETHDIVSYFMRGDIEGARRAQLRALDLISALFVDVNPIPLKTAMNLMGMNVGPCRLPLVDMGNRETELLVRALKDYGLT
ncbi:4-hydroxy-tetrahydrodipicolinate synthase [Rhodospirillum rubrum]|uniref:4-hydroxy-tetrahydrodipicolinate synthase n=1 Tax=Rhodospirillum rubrum (strain ATCC 11170 / ATH 1.1.1 / DSM 467 / LMG 4362 / NCIMB 8255 / S1) TaxID=269796 RepID=Q2RP09_RHORT|nr:4-hydroxy-tetrahydrodipicolinate synthase [Rhodospirillum rubrum]ABC24136.1 dihydrodipicolinate synthase [Rhodospirillum rubrum ATCC 11170]AEO49886.1 dihydrodipicolinate synthase [Rhodospirillum rubrum F11]MBK5955850.1 4-hydroxy-tetrahydrodipicolinate synthase [Rhodospirillum rubrum]QXG80080.1 4-hydroxy-tetrahydrodipicolinate synthase [Rhodospirillum rubrum]HAP99776.1 4-hydroxy-tetrahydrodipicolinate synthase [Rhodospirillum rubrum]